MFSQWSLQKKREGWIYTLAISLTVFVVLVGFAFPTQAQTAAPTDHWSTYDQCNNAVINLMATSYISGFQNHQEPDANKGEKLIFSPTGAWCTDEQTRYENGWFWVYHNGPLLQRGDLLFDPQCNNRIRQARPVVFPQTASAPAPVVQAGLVGPQGPAGQDGQPGPQGPQGPPGETTEAQVQKCITVLGGFVYSNCPPQYSGADYGYGGGSMVYLPPPPPPAFNICFGPSCGGGFYGGGGRGGGRGGGGRGSNTTTITNITNTNTNINNNPIITTTTTPPPVYGPGGSTGVGLVGGTPPAPCTPGPGCSTTGNAFAQTGRGNAISRGNPNSASNNSWPGNRSSVQQARAGNNQSLAPNRNMGTGSTRSITPQNNSARANWGGNNTSTGRPSVQQAKGYGSAPVNRSISPSRGGGTQQRSFSGGAQRSTGGGRRGR